MFKYKKILAVILITTLAIPTFFYFHSSKSTHNPEHSNTAHKPTQNPTGTSTPSTQSPTETVTEVFEAEEEQSKELNGVDFKLTISPNSNPKYQDLQVLMNGNKPIRDFIGMDGQSTKIENLTFNQNDTFELKKLIPEAEREQIIGLGREWLPDGYGALGTYSVYLVEPIHLTEVLSLITERECNGQDKPAQSLQATVTEKTIDGQLTIEYRYSAEKAPYQTILFRWDGKAFVDSSGRYKEIHDQYHP